MDHHLAGFIQNLARVYDQEKISQLLSAVNPSDTKFHWVTRNIDFVAWLAAKGPQALGIIGPDRDVGPMIRCHMTSSKSNFTQQSHTFLSFFSAAIKLSTSVGSRIVHALFYQILTSQSQKNKKKAAVNLFIKQLVQLLPELKPKEQILFEKRTGCKYTFPAGWPLEELLINSPSKNLWTALSVILDSYCASETVIIIDGVNLSSDTTKEVYDFIKRSKVKILWTREIETIVDPSLFKGFQYILYDEERQGKA